MATGKKKGDIQMKGEEIQAIMDKLGVSQEVFARVLNVSFSTVNRWKNQGCYDEEYAKRFRELNELLDRKNVDKNKVKEALSRMGLVHVLTLGAAAGLIARSAVTGFLGPLGIIGGVVGGTLASIFFKDKK